MAKLKLVDAEEPTRTEIEMARMAQAHSEWSGPCGKTEGWTPFSEPQQRPTFDPDAVLDRASRYVVVDSPVPLWRRILRWLRWKW